MQINTQPAEKLAKKKFPMTVWVLIASLLLAFGIGFNRGCAYGKAHPEKASVQATQ